MFSEALGKLCFRKLFGSFADVCRRPCGSFAEAVRKLCGNLSDAFRMLFGCFSDAFRMPGQCQVLYKHQLGATRHSHMRSDTQFLPRRRHCVTGRWWRLQQLAEPDSLRSWVQGTIGPQRYLTAPLSRSRMHTTEQPFHTGVAPCATVVPFGHTWGRYG